MGGIPYRCAVTLIIIIRINIVMLIRNCMATFHPTGGIAHRRDIILEVEGIVPYLSQRES
jgi:hypothetical protein